MDKLAPDRTETCFSDLKKPFNLNQAMVEANRCLYCHEPPCVDACPTRIDIPTFIRKITTENLHGSAATIFSANVLGMSCARVCPVELLCSGSCVLTKEGIPPIRIGLLQRFVTDLAYQRGWSFFQRARPSHRKVALIGSGPASLSCAHRLAQLGHECVIYEKRPFPGGLNTSGIAPYKMQAHDSLAEVDWITSIGGITIRHGVQVGRDPTLQELEANFDAVFIGTGQGPDRRLDKLPGHDLEGVWGAMQFIEELKLASVDLSQVRNAVVLGGGNTAVDAVHELLHLGVPGVTMIYRRGKQLMKGYAHEWEKALHLGAAALWFTVPTAFVGQGCRLSGLKCVSTDSALKPIAGSETMVPADLALLAIGQQGADPMFAELDGIRVQGGNIVVDQQGFTGRRGWYAGGDCTNGGKEVVFAAAQGRTAAQAIHRHLTGNPASNGAQHA